MVRIAIREEGPEDFAGVVKQEPKKPRKRKKKTVPKRPAPLDRIRQPKSASRPAPAFGVKGLPRTRASLYNRYGLVFDPGVEDDPIVSQEMDNLLELYRRQTGRELDRQADVRKSLEESGLIERAAEAAVRKVGGAALRRVAREVGGFASATDALDYLEQRARAALPGRREIEGAIFETSPISTPFRYGGQLRKAGETIGVKVEDGQVKSSGVLSIADRLLGGAGGKAIGFVADQPAPRMRQFGVARALEPSGLTIGEVAEEGLRTAGRGAAFGLRQTGRGLEATGEFLRDRPVFIGTSVMPMPASGRRVGGVVAPVTGSEYSAVAAAFSESPQDYIDAASDERFVVEDEGKQGALDYARETGQPASVIREIIRQQELSPFSPMEDSGMRAQATANGWPEEEWPTLDIAEKIYRTGSRNDFRPQFFRNLIRNIGETAATPAGVVAIIGASAQAAGGDFEAGADAVRAVWGPYAQVQRTADREGELTAIMEFVRDNPLEAALWASTALRTTSRVAGATARQGVFGERMRAYARANEEVVIPGPRATTPPVPRDVPEPRPGWNLADYAERQRIIDRNEQRARAFERGEIAPEDRAAPISVGFTSPRLFQTFLTRTIRPLLAAKSERYRSLLQSRGAERETRWASNVRQGEAIDMRNIFESALGDVSLLTKDRAAFNLVYPEYGVRGTDIVSAARSERRDLTPEEQRIVDEDRVTPGRVADYYQDQRERLEFQIRSENRQAVLDEQQQIDLWRAAEIHLRRLDKIEVPEDAMSLLRARVRRFGERADEIMAEALATTTKEVKRGNYIRMILLDPEFELRAQALRSGRRAARKKLDRAERQLQVASRRMQQYLTPEGWGRLSRPKARRRYNEVRSALLVALRRAERAADEAGLAELAAEYRSARMALGQARLRRDVGRDEASRRLDDLERLRLTGEDVRALEPEVRDLYTGARSARQRQERLEREQAADLEAAGVRRFSRASLEAARRQREELEAEVAASRREARLSEPDFYEITLPPRFFYDHFERDLVTKSGTLDEMRVKENSRQIVVRLHRDDIEELLDDADYYATSMGDAGFEGMGVISSARATVKAIQKQNPGIYQRWERRKRGEPVEEPRLAPTPERASGLRERLEAARAREAALERAGARVGDLKASRKEARAAVAKLRSEVRRGRPVFDTNEVRVVLSRTENYAIVNLKKQRKARKSDDLFSISRARGETLDEFIARAEMTDTNPVLHLVQSPEFDRLGAPLVTPTERVLDVTARGGVRPGRFVESEGYLFRSGQESVRYWDNLLFDTAELITAEGWRKKIQQIIERTSIPFAFNERAIEEANRRVDADPDRRDLEGDERDRAVQAELENIVRVAGAQYDITEFKLLNPFARGAKMPPRRASYGAIRESARVTDGDAMDLETGALNEGALGRVVQQILNERTVDPNAPGVYYLMPIQTWNAIQKVLEMEAFRIRPTKSRLGGLTYSLDRVTRAWRTFTLNVLPRTAFNNLVGSTILALMAGAGPWSMYYAAMAIAGKSVRMADGSQRKLPMPPELRQRYYESLTGRIDRNYLERKRVYREGDVDVDAEIPLLEGALSGVAYWMNTMRLINGASEDFARLAVWYSKAYDVSARTQGSRGFFTKARALNDEGYRYLEALANNDPNVRVLNEQFLRKSFEFLGDLHRGGPFISKIRIAIPFWQWYTHMLKLAFFTMPFKYPGRMLFMEQLSDIGVMYQEAHGLFLPYGEDFIPFYTVLDESDGRKQEMVRGLGAGPWYPMGTISPVGGRDGSGALGFAQTSVNPVFPQAALILSSFVSVAAGGPAVEMDQTRVLRAAKDEYGNEIDSLDGKAFWSYLFNKVFRTFPLSPTIMSQSGRASTALPFDPDERVYSTPRPSEETIDRNRADVVSVVENPSKNIGAFLLKIFGVPLSDLPARGPITEARLYNEYRFQMRDIARQNRNITRELIRIHTSDQTVPADTTPKAFE